MIAELLQLLHKNGMCSTMEYDYAALNYMKQ